MYTTIKSISTHCCISGDSNRRYQGKYMLILRHMKIKSSSKKSTENTNRLSKDFTVVSLDESFFFFDSLVRKIWIYKDSRPVATITGSHRNFCIFGAITLKESSYSDNLKGLVRRIRSMNC